MIRIIVSDEAELTDVLTRHDFAPLFGSVYRIMVQEPDGRLRGICGGGVKNVIHHNGPASLPGPLALGGAGGTGTSTVKRRKRK